MTVDALARIVAGAADVVPRDGLRAKLHLERPLRVKLGVDPTAPDLHLGHVVVLQKLRELQDLGHRGVLIIGDYTALIGDPSGRSATRPTLGAEEIDVNARTYQDQVFKILDPARTEIRRNSEWFAHMRLADVIRLAAHITVARMLERNDFESRYRQRAPIGLHEFLYPLMQGYDSVVVRADIELGGTDQTFNLLVGRDLQRANGQSEQVAITMPLLEGTDGSQKMSKSLGNHIGLTDPPEEMFGKLLSISDVLMDRYATLLVGDDPAWAGHRAEHPLERKKALARLLVARFHGPECATNAQRFFEERFQRRTDFAPTRITVRAGGDQVWICKLLKDIGFAASTSDARRLVTSGSVRVDGRTVGLDFQFRQGIDRLVAVGRRRVAEIDWEVPSA